MRQAAEQDIALGRLAMDPRNLRNWAAVEEGFYRNHPIESPFAVQPPESAIAHLKTNPGTAKQFDEMFGLGSAAKVLGAR
jgi:hypothetical protein